MCVLSLSCQFTSEQNLINLDFQIWPLIITARSAFALRKFSESSLFKKFLLLWSRPPLYQISFKNHLNFFSWHDSFEYLTLFYLESKRKVSEKQYHVEKFQTMCVRHKYLVMRTKLAHYIRWWQCLQMYLMPHAYLIHFSWFSNMHSFVIFFIFNVKRTRAWDN